MCVTSRKTADKLKFVLQVLNLDPDSVYTIQLSLLQISISKTRLFELFMINTYKNSEYDNKNNIALKLINLVLHQGNGNVHN